MELMVVLAITSILTALLFPGMRAARDSAHRLMCASNMRQLGSGMILFAHDHRENLPVSVLAQRGRMLDRMALTVEDENIPGRTRLDGLGLLFQFDAYCDSPKCLYCPSHQNVHQYEEYATDIERSTSHSYSYASSFSNYQYVGDDGSTDRLHKLRDDRILISDGFRTKADYNHRVGMNTIRGDCSIHWWNDDQNQFFLGLPDAPIGATSAQAEIFEEVWSLVGEPQGQDSGANN